MTRFDAATEETRRELFADAIRAHEERESAFLTVETETQDEGRSPWLQFAEGILNVDCTDDELDRVKELLNDYPAFRIDELESPEDADGTNVHIAARADPERVAEFVDRLFIAVYEQPADYRAWVAAI